MAIDGTPILVAVSTSARQLHSLLRCIAFAPKALVHISDSGLKISSYESSVLEGHVLLESRLFNSYRYNASEEAAPASFEISLPALLETLQIFSAPTEPGRDSSRFAPYYNPSKHSAFSNTSLGLPSQLCTISYDGAGGSLTITMTDTHNDPSNLNGPGNVETTCNLTTYEPPTGPSDDRDIPFSRSSLAAKIILQSSWLADAMIELATTSPDRVTLLVDPLAGFKLSATGSLGSADVAFDAPSRKSRSATASFSNAASVQQDPYAATASAATSAAAGQAGGCVLETFMSSERSSNSYKFAHVRTTLLAMKASVKTSVRIDGQGVLSLQFMIESDGGPAGGGAAGDMSFVDFRFVPLVDDESDEEEDTLAHADAGVGQKSAEGFRRT